MHSSLIDNRQIRVFISSTFRDMQDERDYLIQKTFPILRDIAEKRNVSLVEIDLRWGISEEESRKGQTVDLCLQEVDNCHPFFIGILGNRYGWCPTPAEVANLDDIEERCVGIRNDFESGLSVTEVEMQYGVLRRTDRIDALFFIKNDFCPDKEEGPLAAKKLERLRYTVENNGRYPVGHYSSPEEIGSLVYDEFLKILNRYFPENELNGDQLEQVCQKAFLDKKSEGYIVNPSHVNAIRHFLDNPAESRLLITGERGSGKSSLIANWIKQFSRNSGWTVVYHFVGAGNDNGDYTHVCKALTYQFIWGIKNKPFYSSYSKDPSAALKRVLDFETGRTLLLIDGVDSLFNIGNAKSLEWLPYTDDKLKLIVTSTQEDQTSESMRNLQCSEFFLEPLDEGARYELISSYLGRYGKRLTQDRIARIARAKICSNAFVLRTILEELRAFGFHEKIDERIARLTEPEDITGFFNLYFKLLEDLFGKKSISDVFSLIEASRNGLTENEIRTIAHLLPLEWSQIYCHIKKFLVSRSEGLFLAQQSVRVAVEDRYLDDDEEEKTIRKRIVNCFKGKATERSLLELAHQYYLIEDAHSLGNLISQLNNFVTLYTTERHKLVRYWKDVVSETGVTPQVYLEKLELFDPIESRIVYGSMVTVFLMEDLSDLSNALLVAERCRQWEVQVAFSGDDERMHMVYSNLGTLYKLLGRNNEAIDCYMQPIKRSKHPEQSRTIGVLMSNVGVLLSECGRYEESLDLLLRAKELHRTHFSEHSAYYIRGCDALGAVYDSLGNHEEANNSFSEALLLAETTFGKENPDYANICNNIGYRCIVYTGELDKAIYYLQQAITIRTRLYGEGHRTLIFPHENIAQAYRQKNDLKEAFNHQKIAVDLALALYGKNHPVFADAFRVLGDLSIDMGNVKDGLEVCKIALAIRLELENAHSLLSDYYNCLVKGFYILGDVDNALAASEAQLYYAEKEGQTEAIITQIKDNINRVREKQHA